MKTKYIRVTLKQAQDHLGEICNAATSKRDVIIIKRPAGPDVALLAAGELSGLIETLYLLGSPKNAVRLVNALCRSLPPYEV
ncbi:MAG TPA: type II toxin-antitoxin system Phd/YefM family antitoxin [Pyrinomonadaceae bacterium]|nr:type II toxin-antitoxin system Phd/YefM family antitoxin [Pyrinomonadaceae bacterium]